jgi:hypothetical protein
LFKILLARLFVYHVRLVVSWTKQVGLNALNVGKEGMLLILQEKVVALIAVLVVVNLKQVQQPVLIVPQERIKISRHPSHATIAFKTATKIYLPIPRAMHVLVVSVMKSKDLWRAMLSHLDHIFGTKQFEDANQDIFVLAKHSNSLVLPVDTPQNSGPLNASPAPREITPMKNNQFDVKHVQVKSRCTTCFFICIFIVFLLIENEYSCFSFLFLSSL